MFGILIRNFFQYDWLIFALGALNAWIFVQAKWRIKQFTRYFLPKGYIPGGKMHQQVWDQYYDRLLSPEGERQMVVRRQRLNVFAQFYQSLTSIFPLLGILGTVISLIRMTRLTETQQEQAFFLALTSTLWGIVFAILYKVLGGALTAWLDHADELYTLYVERNHLAFQRPNAPSEAKGAPAHERHMDASFAPAETDWMNDLPSQKNSWSIFKQRTRKLKGD